MVVSTWWIALHHEIITTRLVIDCNYLFIPTMPTSLADPPQRQIDAAFMDYFSIEMVNTLRISSTVATTRAKKLEQEMLQAGLIPPATAPLRSEDEEAVRVRLESIGMHVGANITEKYLYLDCRF